MTLFLQLAAEELPEDARPPFPRGAAAGLPPGYGQVLRCPDHEDVLGLVWQSH